MKSKMYSLVIGNKRSVAFTRYKAYKLKEAVYAKYGLSGIVRPDKKCNQLEHYTIYDLKFLL